MLDDGWVVVPGLVQGGDQVLVRPVPGRLQPLMKLTSFEHGIPLD
jgi:hypothetical protein